ncbi:MAG: glycoside hydrolase family 16 protein [Acidobacteriaceae bacterium]|nr:glycoside hydrolase family 16 protein [Acidobacteriaceae bacterium]
MRTPLAWIVLAVVLPGSAQQGGNARLLWSDEFDGPANFLPDPKKWTYDLGAGGWGNQELETYTSSAQNAFLDGNGHLVIQALNDGAGHYTSARLKTQGLFAFRYGRVEARIKAPYGLGIWPAFWMLGEKISSAGWPACGEVDILENFGAFTQDGNKNHGSIHGPGYTGATGLSAAYIFPGGADISDDFHVYGILWQPQHIAMSVDGNVYATYTPKNLPADGVWEFDDAANPFFFLLNIAVGGLPGFVDRPMGTTFPQQMIVDYVRVYEYAPHRR